MSSELRRCQILSLSSLDLSPNTLFGSLFIPSAARGVVYGCQPDAKAFLQVIAFKEGRIVKKTSTSSSNLFSLKSATFDASTLSSRHLVSADLEGGVHVWDLNEESLKVVHVVNKAHQSAINNVDGAGGLNSHGVPQLATASRDGSVKLWDARLLSSSGVRCVVDLRPEADQPLHDCWCVAFGNNVKEEEQLNNGDTNDDNVGRLLAAGYSNGDVKVFDLRMNRLYEEFSIDSDNKPTEGVCSISFDRKNGGRRSLTAVGLKGKVGVFDLIKKSKFESRVKSAGTLWSVTHLPQNRDVCMTTSGSGALQLWRSSSDAGDKTNANDSNDECTVRKLDLLQDCDLSDQPLVHFDWCRDKLGLGLTVGFDQKVTAIICTRLNII